MNDKIDTAIAKTEAEAAATKVGSDLKVIRPPVTNAIVDKSTRAGEPGYSWAELAKAGHCFPQRCPDWSGIGIAGQKMNIMAPNAIPVLIVVCSCGVFNTVPAPTLSAL